MTPLEALADFVLGVTHERISTRTLDRVRLHLFDTVGAMVVGASLPEGIAIRAAASATANGETMAPSGPAFADVGALAATASACARCTEMDDIHLVSCTTPGAIVIPTALALAEHGLLPTFSAFAEAVTAGYDVLVRLGCAIDGPSRLADRVWPTRFAAPFGAAAVTARAIGLDRHAVAGALATALASATGTAIAPRPATTSRWLSLGLAARHGIEGALWARHGVLGNVDLLERGGNRVSGCDVSTTRLLDGLGKGFALDDVGLKPYPIARQALAAVEACRVLAKEHQVDPASVRAIRVGLPAAQAPIVDHPRVPADRFATIVSVQHQAALAVVDPDRLFDARRLPPYDEPAVRRIASLVEVVHEPDLDRHYPTAWPARVTIRIGDSPHAHEVGPGSLDVSTDVGWDEVIRKLARAFGDLPDAPDAARLASTIQALDLTSTTPGLRQLSLVGW